MTLSPEERKAITDYRMERAFDTLLEARDNAKLRHWNLVANRLYYAVFYAGSALLLSKQLSVSTHAGFVRMFNLHFIKCNIFDSKYGKLINTLFHNRQSGDYDDVYDITEDDVLPYFEPVEELLNLISKQL